MGKKYIKDGEVWEEGNWGDKKIGSIESGLGGDWIKPDNGFYGGKVESNLRDSEYKVTEDSSLFGGERGYTMSENVFARNGWDYSEFDTKDNDTSSNETADNDDYSSSDNDYSSSVKDSRVTVVKRNNYQIRTSNYSSNVSNSSDNEAIESIVKLLLGVAALSIILIPVVIIIYLIFFSSDNKRS